MPISLMLSLSKAGAKVRFIFLLSDVVQGCAWRRAQHGRTANNADTGIASRIVRGVNAQRGTHRKVRPPSVCCVNRPYTI